jgi:hypothetical protein
VTSIDTFEKLVPLIEKRDVFASKRLSDLLVDHTLDDIRTLISSSGATAESFSLGMINRQGTRAMVRSTDALLDDWFGITHRKTFVINTCAMRDGRQDSDLLAVHGSLGSERQGCHPR